MVLYEKEQHSLREVDLLEGIYFFQMDGNLYKTYFDFESTARQNFMPNLSGGFAIYWKYIYYIIIYINILQYIG